MFCPKCGKGEQIPDSYCRSCGDYLVDSSSNASLMNRFLGISNPERQVKFTVTIDLVTAIVSGLLVFFLMGYFDATYAKTGIRTPPIVYLVYLFLGFVCAWQLLSFTVGTTFLKKLKSGKKTQDLPGQSKPHSLPAADGKDVVVNSVAEQTTRNLDKVPR
jgi:F0F1-type ATP synthase assembly protein I